MKTRCLSCLLLSLFAFTAQAQRNPVPAIGITDTAKVYPAASYEALTAERLEEQSCLPLEGKEREVLNALFQATNRKKESGSSSPSEGFFVEMKGGDGKRSGYYVGEKTFRWIEENGGNKHYAIPKKMRPRIYDLIASYQDRLKDKDTVTTSYAELPMTSRVMPLNRCMLNPSKGMVTVVFYVLKDSARITPVEYRIDGNKKRGVYVWRSIPLWDRYIYGGTNEKGEICAYSTDGKKVSVREYGDSAEALAALEQMIPGWKEMGDAERMRMLDEKMKWH